MRRYASTFAPLFVVVLAPFLGGCDSCTARPAHENLSSDHLTGALASGIEAAARPSASAPSAAGAAEPPPGVGKPINQGSEPRRASKSELLGLPMALVPGQGAGPIRFGATIETIERLMGAPCEVKTETSCQYAARGIAFELEAGALRAIDAFRRGRAALTGTDGVIVEYGFFNGVLVPDLDFGMTPDAIIEVYGQPARRETIDPPGPDGLAERHFYDGMTLEYDRWSNGKLVLGRLTTSKSATAAASANARMPNLAEPVRKVDSKAGAAKARRRESNPH